MKMVVDGGTWCSLAPKKQEAKTSEMLLLLLLLLLLLVYSLFIVGVFFVFRSFVGRLFVCHLFVCHLFVCHLFVCHLFVCLFVCFFVCFFVSLFLSFFLSLFFFVFFSLFFFVSLFVGWLLKKHEISKKKYIELLSSLQLTARPWKSMVGRLNCFWEFGLIQGPILLLVSGSCYPPSSPWYAKRNEQKNNTLVERL